MRLWRSIGSALAMIGAVSAFKEATACDAVYENATRNIMFDESSFSSLHAIYDRHCSLEGHLRNSSQSAGLDVVVRAIPVKFTGSASSSSQAMSNFCRDYRATRFSSSYQKIVSSAVVVEALDRYNECRRIKSNGVLITHTFVDPGAINFNIELSNTNTVFTLENITHGPTVECGTTAFSDDGS